MTISGGQFGENHIQDFLHGCPINSVSVKQTQRGCFGQIITRSGLSNRFNKKISEKSKWYKDVGEEDYFSLAAQLIFLGDLVELVCSFTDLKILTKLLERMDIDLEIGLSWWGKRMLKLMQVQTGVWQTKCSLFFIFGFLYWSMYSIPDTKKYSIVLLC